MYEYIQFVCAYARYLARIIIRRLDVEVLVRYIKQDFLHLIYVAILKFTNHSYG